MLELDGMALGVLHRTHLCFLQLIKIAWRAQSGDAAGTLGNNVTEHVMNAWHVI